MQCRYTITHCTVVAENMVNPCKWPVFVLAILFAIKNNKITIY